MTIGRRRLAALSLLLSGLAGASAHAETLPTPFTAEQIRDAFPVGLRVLTRTATPDGERLSRMTVVEATVDGMAFSDQEVDAAGQPAGEAVTGAASWEELRDHALFPADRAGRERHSATFALGDLDGWLYVVRRDDGTRTELFFADAHPGPPVLFSGHRDGTELFRAEVIERSVD